VLNCTATTIRYIRHRPPFLAAVSRHKELLSTTVSVQLIWPSHCFYINRYKPLQEHPMSQRQHPAFPLDTNNAYARLRRSDSTTSMTPTSRPIEASLQTPCAAGR